MKKLRQNVSLIEAEARRIALQVRFDSETPQQQRNRQGQFATPPKLAEEMTKLVKALFPRLSPIRFLDPGLGTGVFFRSLLQVYGLESVKSALGFEKDRRLAVIAKSLFKKHGLQVRSTDFTKACPLSPDSRKPNLVACNPPYVRHHHLSSDTKQSLKKATSTLEIKISGLAGLYCYYMLLADRWLSNDGVGVWIIPSEFLDVNYGASIREYLLRRVTTVRVHRFNPSDVQFSDALVTSTIVVFKKSFPPPTHQINFTSGENLLAPTLNRKISLNQLTPEEKWSNFFRREKTIPLRPRIGVPTLGQLFHVKRGLATGANDFFILEKAEARRLGLPSRFLRPILPNNRHIDSDIVSADLLGQPIGVPSLFLLDCPLSHKELPKFPRLYQYIQEGERRGIDKGYLLSNRTPWYLQEYRPAPPILCTYMGRMKRNGSSFRFIRNLSLATAANVYLLLYPKARLAAAASEDPSVIDRIFEHLRYAKNLEFVGRVYGGGLNKLEPSELSKYELPAYFAQYADSDRQIDRKNEVSESSPNLGSNQRDSSIAPQQLSLVLGDAHS